MKKLLLIVVISAGLFLAASNPSRCDFRTYMVETIREDVPESNLPGGWVRRELTATLIGEAVRRGAHRTGYLFFSTHTLDPTDALPDVVAVEGASWTYIGVGGFFIPIEKPTVQLSSDGS